MQRKCACGGTPGPTGECEACKRKRLALQPKLTINQPGDRYEKEADEMADAVMTGTRANRPVISSLGAGNAVQRDEPKREEPKFNADYKEKTEEEKYKEAAKKVGEPGLPPAATRSPLSPWAPDLKLTGETTEEPKKKEEETLQRKSAGHDAVSHAPAIVDDVLQSSGEPLDRSTRALMEQRFGYDFGAVRIHNDTRAAESARAVDARAFTVGRDIVFATGQFAPESTSGQRLLAHELAHVIQQREATTTLGSDSASTGARPALQRKRPTEFDEPAGDPSFEGPRFTKRRAVCLEPNTFAVDLGVGPNDQKQVLGLLKIDFRGRGRTRWRGGKQDFKQHYFGTGGWEKVDGKICDCDCMLYQQFIRGVAFERTAGATAFQKKTSIKSGSNWELPFDGQWHQEGALEHSRRCGSEATWHGCKRQYCDEPGVPHDPRFQGPVKGLEVLLRYNFLFQVWDLCQEKSVTEQRQTLTIAGDTPPRAIKWDPGWLPLNRNQISAVVASRPADSTPVSGQQTPSLQRKADSAGTPDHAPPIVSEVLQSTGQPLDAATRVFMEERFGHDFGQVRVHCDRQAGESARGICADAYTLGHHIVFAPERYAPATSVGQKLIAHELVHVLQQSGDTGRASSKTEPRRSSREQTEERAAREPSSQSMPVHKERVDSPRIQRQAAGGGKPTPSAQAPCLIHFRKGTTEFTNAKEFAKCMKAIRAHLKGAGVKKIVELHGYASEEGTTAFNQELSEKRAKIVKLLLGKGGIDTSQLNLSAHGEDNSYRTHEENRRVEVILPAPRVSDSNDRPGPPLGETLRKLYEMAPEPSPEKEKDPVEIEIGKEMRVNVPDSPAWAKIVPDYWVLPQGEAFELSHFIKVKVIGLSEKRLGFVKIEILEGRNKGDKAEIDRANLGPAAASSGPAHTRFTLSSNEFWYGGKGPVKAISHSAKLLPTGRYDVQIPDYSHDKGDKYGDYATTWFLVGDSSDKYLHPGFASLGCVTVEIKMGDTTTWPAIWKYLISARKDDKHVGDIEINAGGLSVCEKECNEEFERCLKASSTGGMECMPVKQACYAKCAKQP